MAEKQHGGKRVGAGRKVASPEGKTIPVTAAVPEGLIASLDELAGQRGWNRSEAVTEAVRRLVNSKRKA
jgi:hypothetical protein